MTKLRTFDLIGPSNPKTQRPLYRARLSTRADRPGQVENTVIDRSFALRVLARARAPVTLDGLGNKAFHPPTLLLARIRADDYGEEFGAGVRERERKLHLDVGDAQTWDLDIHLPDKDHAFDEYEDAVVVPEADAWPPKDSNLEIEIPRMRLVAGRVPILVEWWSARDHLGLDRKAKTAFGGLPADLKNINGDHLPATLTAEGIEFVVSVMRPGLEDAELVWEKTAVRLEWDAAASSGFALRLVERSETIAGPLGAGLRQLRGGGAPLRVDYDERRSDPGLRLSLARNADNLTVDGLDVAARRWRYLIDPDALLARIVSADRGGGADPAVADIAIEHAEFARTGPDGFALLLNHNHNHSIADAFDITARRDTYWALTVNKGNALDVVIENEPLREVLTPIYRDQKVVGGDAGYAFVPLTRGWLQIDLTLDEIAGQAVQPSSRGNGFSGEIVAQIEAGRSRLRIGSAVEARAEAVWGREGGAIGPTSVTVELGGLRGFAEGLMFASLASPGRTDALPDLLAGSAFLMPVPLRFGLTAGGVAGKLTFNQADPIAKLEFAEPRHWTWLPHGSLCAVPAITMNRAGTPGGSPSASRELLPLKNVAPTLGFYAKSAVARLESAAGGNRPEGWPVARLESDEGGMRPRWRGDGVPMATVATAGLQISSDVDFETTGLRYDLPILDELFATTTAPGQEPVGGNGTTEGDAGPVPTALIPELLAEIWADRADRLVLTHVQQRVVAPRHGNVEVDGLLEDVMWDATFEVVPAEDQLLPFGAYRFFARGAGQGAPVYQGEGALIGLEAMSFDIKTRNRRARLVAAANDGLVKVRGLAAASFEKDGLVHDARRFGQARALADGVGAVRMRLVAVPAAADPKPDVLATAEAPIPIVFDGAELGFWFRDLPMRKRGDEHVFIAEAEGRNDHADAFEPSRAPLRLYEWRLWGMGEAADQFAFPLGDVTFEPLALCELSLTDGDVTVAKFLGRIRPAAGHASVDLSGGTRGPFGPEAPYADEAIGVLEVSDGTVKLTGEDGGALEFESSIPLIVPLTSDPNVPERLRSTRTVAVVRLVVEESTGRLVRGGSSLRARLLGAERTLAFDPQTGGPKGSFKLLGNNPGEGTGAEISSGWLTPGTEWSLGLSVRARIVAPGKAVRLIRFEADLAVPPGGPDQARSLRWLGMRGNAWCTLDHRTGTIVIRPTDEPVEGDDARLVEGLPLPLLTIKGRVAVGPSDAPDEIAFARLVATGENGFRLEHSVMVGPGAPKEDRLDIDWTIKTTSTIRWPYDRLVASGDNIVTVKPGDVETRHHVTVLLAAQELSTEALEEDGDGALRLARNKSWCIFAPVRHVVGEWEWHGLDHIEIGPAANLCTRPNDVVFAARYKERKFRGKTAPANPQWGGLFGPAHGEGGFSDWVLQSKVGKAVPEAVVIVGGAGAMVERDTADGTLGFPFVLPWLAPLGNDPVAPLDDLQSLAPADYRVAVNDLHDSRVLLAPYEAAPRIVIGDPSPAGIAGMLGHATTGQSVPVDQMFVELLEDGKPVPTGRYKTLDHRGFPLFMRALLALRSEPRGRITSLVPLDEARSGAVRARFELSDAASRTPGPTSGGFTLVAFSRTNLVSVRVARAAGAVRAETVAGGPGSSAELASIARASLDDPSVAFVLVPSERGPDRVADVREVGIPPPLTFETPPRHARGGAQRYASPHLGWPTGTGAERVAKAPLSAGDDSPSISARGGVAGRTATFATAPWAQAGSPRPGHDVSVAGILAFETARRVSFVRDEASSPSNARAANVIGFSGPPVRHFQLAPPRARAPLSSRLREAVEQVASTEGGGTVGRLAPIVPPWTERAIYGTRPGAFFLYADSMVAPLDLDEQKEAFDDHLARYGRPASRGPIVLRQMRSPRSVPLPNDEDLRLRRRLFVSAAMKAQDGSLTGFLYEKGTVGVLRAGAGADAAAVILRPATQDIDPELSPFLLKGETFPASEPTDVFERLNLEPARIEATLRVGTTAFALSVAVSGTTITLTLAEKRDLARARIIAATAADKIELELKVQMNDAGPPASSLLKNPFRVVTLALIKKAAPDVPLVAQATVVFADPAYDRRLGGATRAKRRRLPDGAMFLLATDRPEYTADLTVYFAFGLLKGSDDGSEPLAFRRHGTGKLWVTRLRPPGPESDGPEERLEIAIGEIGSVDVVEVDGGTPMALPLPDVVAILSRTAQPGDPPPLLPGDRLEFAVEWPGLPGGVNLAISIVAEAVIPPPDAVHAVVGAYTNGNGDLADREATVPLIASGAWPERIDFVDLERGLATGFMARHALFVWRFATPRELPKCGMVKVDRSGGGQSPSALVDPAG